MHSHRKAKRENGGYYIKKGEAGQMLEGKNQLLKRSVVSQGISQAGEVIHLEKL